ncbi:unnamed protein product [Prorocentrum cordatum]|uniref:Uncharacterized protein n=1 Tax=Prorocentrum cordatum TaxID=2364126 RepID=A0ABN9R4M3_9DINO|nr:unnamed protein product [Polarella glacialis]
MSHLHLSCSKCLLFALLPRRRGSSFPAPPEPAPESGRGCEGFSDFSDPRGEPNAIVRSAMHLMSAGVLDCPDDVFLGPKAPCMHEVLGRREAAIWIERPLVQGCFRKAAYIEGEVRMHYIFNSSHPSTWLVRPWGQDGGWDISVWLGLSCHGDGICRAYNSMYMNKSISWDDFEAKFPVADFQVLDGWSCGLNDDGGAARITWRTPPRKLWQQFGKPITRSVEERAEWSWLFCPEPNLRSALVLDELSGVALAKATRFDNIRAVKSKYGDLR